MEKTKDGISVKAIRITEKTQLTTVHSFLRVPVFFLLISHEIPAIRKRTISTTSAIRKRHFMCVVGRRTMQNTSAVSISLTSALFLRHSGFSSHWAL